SSNPPYFILMNSTGYPSATLTNLTPATTYHVRCKVTNGEGTAYGVDTTFTTPGLPVLVTGGAANVTATAAELTGTANANGGGLYIDFEYGLTPSYGFVWFSEDMAFVYGAETVAETAIPFTLQPGTTYHYRIRGYDGAGTYYDG